MIGASSPDQDTRMLSPAARLIVVLMRSVPGIFTLALGLLGGVWLAGGRTLPGLVLLGAAAGAMGFGLRIAVASRLEVRNRGVGSRRTELTRYR